MKKWPYVMWISLGALLMGLATILGVSFDSTLLLLGLGLLGLASAIWGLFVGLNRAASGGQDNPEHHN